MFFTILLLTASKPFAIITAAGKSRNNNSDPFLFGINSANSKANPKFIINRIQFFLKELFTENAFGDFKNNDISERIIIATAIQYKLPFW